MTRHIGPPVSDMESAVAINKKHTVNLPTFLNKVNVLVVANTTTQFLESLLVHGNLLAKSLPCHKWQHISDHLSMVLKVLSQKVKKKTLIIFQVLE